MRVGCSNFLESSRSLFVFEMMMPRLCITCRPRLWLSELEIWTGDSSLLKVFGRLVLVQSCCLFCPTCSLRFLPSSASKREASASIENLKSLKIQAKVSTPSWVVDDWYNEYWGHKYGESDFSTCTGHFTQVGRYSSWKKWKWIETTLTDCSKY